MTDPRRTAAAALAFIAGAAVPIQLVTLSKQTSECPVLATLDEQGVR